MLKKTIKFLDLDENEVTEDFYFHIGKAELIEWELSEAGGYTAHLERALEQSKKGDSREIANLLRTLIVRSIGVRGADNREFDRQDGAVARRFVQLDAYSVLFEELGESATAAADFLEAAVPTKVRQDAAAEIAKRKAELVNLPDGVTAGPQPAAQAAPAADPNPKTETIPKWELEDRDMTSAEARSATAEQLRDAYLRKAARDDRDKTPSSDHAPAS